MNPSQPTADGAATQFQPRMTVFSAGERSAGSGDKGSLVRVHEIAAAGHTRVRLIRRHLSYLPFWSCPPELE